VTCIHGLISVLLIFLTNTIAPITLVAIICREENRHLTVLAITGMVCYIVGIPPIIAACPFLVFFHPVGAVMIIVDGIRTDHFNAATKAVLANLIWAFSAVPILMVTWDLSLRQPLYKAWLASFEEDWDTNGKDWLWWRFFHWNAWILGSAMALWRRWGLEDWEF